MMCLFNNQANRNRDSLPQRQLPRDHAINSENDDVERKEGWNNYASMKAQTTYCEYMMRYSLTMEWMTFMISSFKAALTSQ